MRRSWVLMLVVWCAACTAESVIAPVPDLAVVVPDLAAAPDDLAVPDLAASVPPGDLATTDEGTAPPGPASPPDMSNWCPCSAAGGPGFYCANDVFVAQPASCVLPFSTTNATQLWRCVAPNVWTVVKDCADVAGSAMKCKSCPSGCPDACQLTDGANDSSCFTADPIPACMGR